MPIQENGGGSTPQPQPQPQPQQQGLSSSSSSSLNNNNNHNNPQQMMMTPQQQQQMMNMNMNMNLATPVMSSLDPNITTPINNNNVNHMMNNMMNMNDIISTTNTNTNATTTGQFGTLKDMESEIVRAQKENFNLKMNIFYLEDKFSKLQANDNGNNNTNNSINTDLINENKEFQIINHEMEMKLETQNELLIQAKNEIMRLKNENDYAIDTINQMKDMENKAIVMEKRIISERKETVMNMNLLETEIQKLKNSNENLLRDNMTFREETNEMKQQMLLEQDTKRIFEESKQNLIRENESLRDRLSNEERKNVEEIRNVKEKDGELKTWETKYNTVMGNLEEVKKREKETHEMMEKDNEKYRKEIRELKDKIENEIRLKSKVISDLNDHKQEKEILGNENHDLKMKIEKVENKLIELKKEEQLHEEARYKLKDMKTNLQQELEETTIKCDKLINERTDMINQMSHMEKSLSHTRQEFTDNERHAQTLQRDNDRLTNMLSEMQKVKNENERELQCTIRSTEESAMHIMQFRQSLMQKFDMLLWKLTQLESTSDSYLEGFGFNNSGESTSTFLNRQDGMWKEIQGSSSSSSSSQHDELASGLSAAASLEKADAFMQSAIKGFCDRFKEKLKKFQNVKREFQSAVDTLVKTHTTEVSSYHIMIQRVEKRLQEAETNILHLRSRGNDREHTYQNKMISMETKLHQDKQNAIQVLRMEKQELQYTNDRLSLEVTKAQQELADVKSKYQNSETEKLGLRDHSSEYKNAMENANGRIKRLEENNQVLILELEERRLSSEKDKVMIAGNANDKNRLIEAVERLKRTVSQRDQQLDQYRLMMKPGNQLSENPNVNYENIILQQFEETQHMLDASGMALENQRLNYFKKKAPSRSSMADGVTANDLATLKRKKELSEELSSDLEKTTMLIKNIELLVQTTSTYFNRFVSLRETSRRSAELIPSWLQNLEQECYQLLDGNCQLTIQLNQLGLDLQRVYRKFKMLEGNDSRSQQPPPPPKSPLTYSHRHGNGAIVEHDSGHSNRNMDYSINESFNEKPHRSSRSKYSSLRQSGSRENMSSAVNRYHSGRDRSKGDKDAITKLVRIGSDLQDIAKRLDGFHKGDVNKR